VLTAAEAIAESGSHCYRIVYDTFHHYLGPDRGEAFIEELDVSLIGLIHASGVEEDLDRKELGDEHRVLITDADRVGNIDQIARLIDGGYTGDIALEPFSPQVQDMEKRDLLMATTRCVEFLIRRL
jgi:2-keto-myo-inositol isomerase